jgi:hypothetical protein
VGLISVPGKFSKVKNRPFFKKTIFFIYVLGLMIFAGLLFGGNSAKHHLELFFFIALGLVFLLLVEIETYWQGKWQGKNHSGRNGFTREERSILIAKKFLAQDKIKAAKKRN